MADRDRYDWERGREYGDRDREYGRGNDRERGYQDRGMMSRGADEVRSWFGDDDAQRRREMDEQRDREQGRDPGANSERARREHGWTSGSQSSDPSWRSSRGGSYGDQRDFITRGNDWSGSQYSPRGREWDDPSYGRGGQWQGGARDYGDEDSRRYDSGSYRTQNAGPFGGSGGFGAQQSYGPRTSGWDSYGSSGTSRYGSDSGMTGEGRWSGRNSSTNYSAGGGFSGGSSPSNYSGGSYAGRGPRSYQRSDDRVREDVNECLTADPRVDASDIDVRVQNGEVILSGTVDERRTRRLAEEIIENLPGVRDVRNELKVSKGSWFGGDNDRDDRDRYRQSGEQARGKEDGSLGHTGDPQKRDDVTTLNTKDTGKR